MITRYCDVAELKGKTLVSVEIKGITEIHFTCNDGQKFIMHHRQDCCESVTIEDICGDLNDLINSPVILAEEVTNEGGNCENYYSYTYTFYKFATIKGYVDIRWYGESNGYYSESVDFAELP